jgi:hypothetical protein
MRPELKRSFFWKEGSSWEAEKDAKALLREQLKPSLTSCLAAATPSLTDVSCPGDLPNKP